MRVCGGVLLLWLGLSAAQFQESDFLKLLKPFESMPLMQQYQAPLTQALTEGFHRGLGVAENDFWKGKDRPEDLKGFESTYGHEIAPGISSEDQADEEEKPLESPEMELQQIAAVTSDSDWLETPPKNPYDTYLAKSSDPEDISINEHMSIPLVSHEKPPQITKTTKLLPRIPGPSLFESEQALISPQAGALQATDPMYHPSGGDSSGTLGSALLVTKADSHVTPEQFGGPSEMASELGIDTSAPAVIGGVELAGGALDLSNINTPDPNSSGLDESDIAMPDSGEIDELMDVSKRVYRRAHGLKSAPGKMERATEGMMVDSSKQKPSASNHDLARLLTREDNKMGEQIHAQLEITVGGETRKRSHYSRGFDEGHRLGYKIYKNGIRSGFDSGYSEAYKWVYDLYARGYRKGYEENFDEGVYVAEDDRRRVAAGATGLSILPPSEGTEAVKRGITPEAEIEREELNQAVEAEEALDAQEQHHQEVVEENAAVIDEEAASIIEEGAGDSDEPADVQPMSFGAPGSRQPNTRSAVTVDPLGNGDEMGADDGINESLSLLEVPEIPQGAAATTAVQLALTPAVRVSGDQDREGDVAEELTPMNFGPPGSVQPNTATAVTVDPLNSDDQMGGDDGINETLSKH